MSIQSEYEEREIAAASASLSKGHNDPANLRELLICTTSTTTCVAIDAYFHKHHHDEALLSALVLIALEGEDAGDAPWAAANTIAEFPASMLVRHKTELEELSKNQWIYLKKPALEALAKIDTIIS